MELRGIFHSSVLLVKKKNKQKKTNKLIRRSITKNECVAGCKIKNINEIKCELNRMTRKNINYEKTFWFFFVNL